MSAAYLELKITQKNKNDKKQGSAADLLASSKVEAPAVMTDA